MNPDLYHAHHNRHLDDLPFWQGLAARQRGLILELGCGIGRLLIPLAEAGYRLVGLDYDAGMLEALKARLPVTSADRVDLVQADLRAIPLARRFQLIILPCNTLSTVPREDLPAFFQRVAGCLVAGGIFAASLPNPESLAVLKTRGEPVVEEIFPHPDTGDPIQVSSAWERVGDRVTFTWIYDHLLPDGQVVRKQISSQHEVLLRAAYQTALEENGLTLLEVYGDIDQSSYSPESPYLILVAGPA